MQHNAARCHNISISTSHRCQEARGTRSTAGMKVQFALQGRAFICLLATHPVRLAFSPQKGRKEIGRGGGEGPTRTNLPPLMMAASMFSSERSFTMTATRRPWSLLPRTCFSSVVLPAPCASHGQDSIAVAALLAVLSCLLEAPGGAWLAATYACAISAQT